MLSYYGFKIFGYNAPFSVVAKQYIDLVKLDHRYATTVYKPLAKDAIIKEDVNPYRLWRTSLEQNDLSKLKKAIDRLIEIKGKAFIYFTGHEFNKQMSKNKIEAILKYIQQKHIKVVLPYEAVFKVLNQPMYLSNINYAPNLLNDTGFFNLKRFKLKNIKLNRVSESSFDYRDVEFINPKLKGEASITFETGLISAEYYEKPLTFSVYSHVYLGDDYRKIRFSIKMTLIGEDGNVVKTSTGDKLVFLKDDIYFSNIQYRHFVTGSTYPWKRYKVRIKLIFKNRNTTKPSNLRILLSNMKLEFNTVPSCFHKQTDGGRKDD